MSFGLISRSSLKPFLDFDFDFLSLKGLPSRVRTVGLLKDELSGIFRKNR